MREVAQFVGKASATIQALPTAPLHYRALQFMMNSVHPAGTRGGNQVQYHGAVRPDEQVRPIMVDIP